MKGMAVLLAIVWFTNCAALAQDAASTSELDAWRELRQQYMADLDLWRAHFQEATQPMSTGKKILMGLAYVGDKTVTGFVNYYSSRAAIRSEMGRFDARFRSVEGNILGNLNQAAGSLAEGQGNILGRLNEAAGSLAEGQGNILGSLNEATGSLAEGQGNILGSINEAAGSLAEGQGNILGSLNEATGSLAEGQGNILEGLSGNESDLEVLLNDRLPPCITPFGPTGREPCR